MMPTLYLRMSVHTAPSRRYETNCYIGLVIIFITINFILKSPYSVYIFVRCGNGVFVSVCVCVSRSQTDNTILGIKVVPMINFVSHLLDSIEVRTYNLTHTHKNRVLHIVWI